jgi:uncharacterized protein
MPPIPFRHPRRAAAAAVRAAAGRDRARSSSRALRAARFVLVLAIAGLSLAGGQAWAQRVEGARASASGMYEAEVAVNSQTDAERRAGFARALAQVLAKISGDRGAAGRPGVAEELRKAADYVRSYDYRQDEGVSAGGAPRYTTTLVVRFDPEAVNQMAGALGVPVWPEPRPKPVLWLAIDDGSGPRLVGARQNNVARPIIDRAVARGYRLGLPQGNAAEQAVVGAIWRGDTAAIARASARYKPDMQLVGKLYRHDGGWKSDWIFVDGGRVLSQWSAEQRDARQALASGADGAADALSRRYAKAPPDTGPAGDYRVVFTGIRGSEDYLRLSAYLQGLAVVRGITPLRAAPDQLELELSLSTGLSGLRRMAARGGVIEPVEAEGEGPARYRLR